MAKIKKKSKKELLTDQIAVNVRAGREVAVETVDFADSSRPKTCIEVDFPIVPINRLASMEAHAGVTTKPIYQMSKWWARRPSSVFRSMLMAAAMKAPEDESQAAKAVWDVYYANHQQRGALRTIKVADPFMGGGTTIVEGSRLGMDMFGCDLNPVAWLLVKNEMAHVDIADVKRLLADIEAELKPLLAPYYACDGPDGEKGKWFLRKGTKACQRKPIQLELSHSEPTPDFDIEDDWEELPADFDVFAVPWQQRKDYRYEGPEILYTFWAKHGPCEREGCGHRTPIMSTPVVAVKSLTTSAWLNYSCWDCGNQFDVERDAPRMSPDTALFIAPDEKPFAVMDDEGRFTCPHCGSIAHDERALANGSSPTLGKASSKTIELTLLVHPQWLDGCPKHDEIGWEYGGSATDSVEATIKWNGVRASKLRLLEVRGKLPERVTCPETNITFYTDSRGGTVPKKSTFACAADGSPNDVLNSIRASNKTGPMAAYVVQSYSAARDEAGKPYGGRFFAAASDVRRYNSAAKEWDERKNADLKGFWPTSELPFGFMTHMNNGGIPNHGYTHWWKMFSPLQLLVHSQLLRTITEVSPSAHSWEVREFVLGAFHNYLRNQSLLTFWHIKLDTIAPALSNSNFHPKPNVVETGVFSPMGYGPWTSTVRALLASMEWMRAPWELARIDTNFSSGADNDGRVGNTVKIPCTDTVSTPAVIECQSATDLVQLGDETVDLVITDPPFGGLLHYAELADYFYVWHRLVLQGRYPTKFGPEYSPKTLEAVANRARHPDDPDAFYQRVLTDCWRESYRVLKPGGILAFTFHHSEDDPWVRVLESLFEAGFYLESAYPIRSDETKGDGAKPGTFGSMTIEYDIIHVCRKRMTNPQPISWARLRRQISDDVRRIKILLTQHESEGLPQADLQVIKRGKALEYFSRHYGKVYIEQGREFTIREALVGINQLLEDDAGATGGPEPPPSNAEPYTRQFFRLFYETTEVPRDQMQKFLRGTGIAPSDFTERGWCSEKNKVFTLTPPIELARAWKGASRKGMARDFDQAMFLVGGCFDGSNIRIIDTLDSPNFAPHPATAELVEWLISHGGSPQIKIAAQRAQTIYRDWLGRNKAKAQEQLSLFDLES